MFRIVIVMLVSKHNLRKLIREAIKEEFLKEDSWDQEGTRYTIDKAKSGEEPGIMGIDPDDMKDQILDQFSVTAGSLVNFIKEVRVMREMAGEMSQMEAEGAISGDFGTRMWHAISSVDRAARLIVKKWNNLNNIK